MRPRRDADPAKNRRFRQAIGGRVRVAREARGLIQEEVAERAGISTEFYARIERGSNLPSVPTLGCIASILDISADALLGFAEMPRFEPPARIINRQEQHRNALTRRLRRARPGTLRMVARVLDELERTAHSSSEITSDEQDTYVIPEHR